MAIKGGDLIHTGNLVLIDRAQTAGPGQVNINKDKIYELGNYYSLANIYDIPDLTFSLESFDVSAEFEALMLNKKFSAPNGTQVVTISGAPTGGTFTISYAGQTTTGIAYNASATTVQTALVALSNLASGDMVVTGSAGGPYTITFDAAFLTAAADANPAVTVSGSSLTGGTSPSVAVVSTDGIQMVEGTLLDPAKCLPIDVASAFKPGFRDASPYNVVGSVAIPFLQLESLSYKFGVTDTASQSASLRGDSVFYNPGATYVEVTTGTNSANQVVTAAHPAVVYHGDTVNSSVVDSVTKTGTRYALSVCLTSGKRLLPGSDYTETVTSGVLTVTVKAAVATTDAIRIIYASTDAATYPQSLHAPVTVVRPAAIKGRNVEVYIGGVAIGNRWTSVQSVTVDWKVTLEKDQEMGNAQVVSNTYDTPDVSGSVDLKPRDYAELYAKVCQIAGVTSGEVAGPLTTVPLSLLVKLHSPDTGVVLKSIYVPDARFTVPGFSGQAGQGQKITVSFPFESDTGSMFVYKGDKP